MSKFDLNGKLTIENGHHVLEYEPGAMVGLGTLFLRVDGGQRNVPIHRDRLDDVISMLERGRDLLDALEKPSTEPSPDV